MAIQPLQIPQTRLITPDLGPMFRETVDAINKGMERKRLSDLGKGIADGSISYREAAGTLASLGNPSGMMQMLQMAEAKDKLGREQAASQQFNSNLGTMFGGGSGNAAPVSIPGQPALPGRTGPIVQDDGNAMPGTVGMNMRLADLASDFLQDHSGTSISSGYRSTADQQRLYDNRASNPNPVAVPGTSNHERGMAVDIAGMTPQQRALLPQYGLSQPVPGDPPHVELSASERQQQPYRVASADNASLPMNAQATQGVQPTGGFQGITAAQVPMLIQARSNPNLPASQREFADRLLMRFLDESKTPDKIRTLNQLKAASNYPGTILDLEKELKAAGAINIDQRAETGEAKAAGEAAGKRRAEMFAAAGSAGKTLTNLSRMEGLLNQVSQGKLSPARMNISAWAKSLGLNDDVAKALNLDPQGVGSAQAVQSLINESVVGKIGQGGFPANNFSDADREFITRIFPSLGDDPRANKIRIEGARRMARLDIERAKAFQAFKRDPANKGRGFEDFELDWSEKMAQRDVFGDLRREAESIIGAPRDDIGGTINNPGAAPQRGATGSWGNQQPPVQGARQASDGKFYVPDPNRPGKYLEVR